MNILVRICHKLNFKLGGLKAKLLGVKVGAGTRIAVGATFDLGWGGEIEIGCNSIIHAGAVLSPRRGGRIQIGDNCSVNPYSILYGHGGLTIGNGVRIAAHCVIVPANHIFAEMIAPIHQQGINSVGIVIEDNVWLGAGVRVLDGVRIGSGVVVAAGAVVNKDLEQDCLYGGVPARLIRRRSDS